MQIRVRVTVEGERKARASAGMDLEKYCQILVPTVERVVP